MDFSEYFRVECENFIRTIENGYQYRSELYTGQMIVDRVLYHVWSDSVYLGTLIKKVEGKRFNGYFFDSIPKICDHSSVQLRNFSDDLRDKIFQFELMNTSSTDTIVEGTIVNYTPSILLGWDLHTIPEDHGPLGTVGKSWRKVIEERLNEECPIYGFTHIDAYASSLCNWNLSHWKRYSDYFVKINGKFDTNYTGGNSKICVEKDILASLRLMCTLMTEVYSRILELSQVDRVVLDEIHAFIIKEPLQNTQILKKMLEPFINSAFACSKEGLICDWENFNFSDRNAKLRRAKIREFTSVGAINFSIIDEEGIQLNSTAMIKLGLIHTNKMANFLLSARVNSKNVRSVTFLKTFKALCGFTGSSMETAVVQQLDSYKDFISPTVDGLDAVVSTFKEVTRECIINSEPTVRTLLLKRIPRFLTSRSAGMPQVKSTKVSAYLESKVWSDGNMIRKRYQVNINMKDKVMVYLRDIASILSENIFDECQPAYLGSRIVTGGKDRRIIFPIALPMYLIMQLACEPMTETLLRKIPGKSKNMMMFSGAGQEYGMAHHTLAHILYSSSKGKDLIICTDYATFDGSQINPISAAEHYGFIEGVKTFIQYNLVKEIKCDTWLEWGYLQMCLKAFPLSGSDFSFQHSGACGKYIVRTSMLCSGVPNTSSFNTVRNIALLLHQEKLMSSNNCNYGEIIYATKVGDDSAVIKTCRGNYDEMAKTEIKWALETAVRGHVKLSAKRCTVATMIAEHIKVGIAFGFIVPNMQMQFLFSEKSFMLNNDPFQKVSTLKDNLSVASCRNVSMEKGIELMDSVLVELNKINTPELTFIIGPGVKYCTRGAGIDPECPVLSKGIRLHLHKPYICLMNQLYNGMAKLMNVGDIKDLLVQACIKDIRTDSAGIGVISRLDYDKDILNNHSVLRMNSHNAVQYLASKSIGGKFIPQIAQQGRNRLLESVIKMKFIKGEKSVIYKYDFTDKKFIDADTAHPYIAASEEIRQTIRHVGLSFENVLINDPAGTINNILRRYMDSTPSHINGRDVITILSSVPSIQWSDAFKALGFSDSPIDALVAIGERILLSIEIYGDLSEAYYGGPIMLMDLSSGRIAEMTETSEIDSRKSMDKRLFGSMVAIKAIFLKSKDAFRVVSVE